MGFTFHKPNRVQKFKLSFTVLDQVLVLDTHVQISIVERLLNTQQSSNQHFFFFGHFKHI